MDPITELKALEAKTSAIVTEVKASGRVLSLAEIAALEADRERMVELKGIVASTQRSTNLLNSLTPAANLDNGPADLGTTEAKGFVTAESLKSMAREAAPAAAKALVAGGSSVTPVALNESPLLLGKPTANLGILGVVPVIKRNSPTYAYLRQTVRTNNAAVVASGAQKPTSVFTVESVQSSLSVVAHLSEYVDKYLLRDNENLKGFIESELLAGIFAKVTSLAVTAFSTASGIQTQAFSTNIMDSIYLGASKIEDLGYSPNVVLLSRATFDTLALAKDADGNYLYKRDEDGRLNGLYPVIASGLPANSAIVLDSSKVAISTDKDGLLTEWDTTTKLDYNQARALMEGRFNPEVLAPAAIAKVALV